MSCTDVVTENCDDADLFVSLDTRDLEHYDYSLKLPSCFENQNLCLNLLLNLLAWEEMCSSSYIDCKWTLGRMWLQWMIVRGEKM